MQKYPISQQQEGGKKKKKAALRKLEETGELLKQTVRVSYS